MGRFGGFIRTMFGLEKRYKIRRVKVVEEAESDEAKAEMLRHRLIVMITRLMGAAFCISLLAIVGFPLLGRDPPQALSEILFATLGYFGGVWATFMQTDTS